jgi:hypothetical protein
MSSSGSGQPRQSESRVRPRRPDRHSVSVSPGRDAAAAARGSASLTTQSRAHTARGLRIGGLLCLLAAGRRRAVWGPRLREGPRRTSPKCAAQLLSQGARAIIQRALPMGNLGSGSGAAHGCAGPPRRRRACSEAPLSLSAPRRRRRRQRPRLASLASPCRRHGRLRQQALRPLRSCPCRRRACQISAPRCSARSRHRSGAVHASPFSAALERCSLARRRGCTLVCCPKGLARSRLALPAAQGAERSSAQALRQRPTARSTCCLTALAQRDFAVHDAQARPTTAPRRRT